MEQFADINWALLSPIIIIQFILMAIAMFDWATSEDRKWLWFWLILLVSFVGPILYFIFGRRQHE